MYWLHPEIRNGEVFFKNMTEQQFELLAWHSKRRGVTAYDGNGDFLDRNDWFPVFVKARELVDRGFDPSPVIRLIEGNRFGRSNY